MDSTGSERPAQADTIDREIVVSRVIDASRELVFEAFTEVRHLSQWWGPKGFTTTTRAFEFRVGAVWDFVMHGPDETEYQEWITWTDITPPERIAAIRMRSSRSSRSSPTGRRPGSRCSRCSSPRNCATRRSRSTARSRAVSRHWPIWLPT